jgi:eukaryotic-like serine/threonine-protein kinase
VLGTPAYMSPEQFNGQVVDGRSDIFSCGVILYQFLTGEKPFTGNTTTIMFKVLQEEPLPPSTLNSSLPRAFDAVIKRAMAKSTADRYQSAAEFAEAINKALTQTSAEETAPNLTDSLPANAKAVTSPNVAAAPVAAAAEAAASAPNKAPAPVSNAAAKPASAPSSKAPVLVALGALSVLALAIGGYYMFGRDRAAMPQIAPATGTTPAVAQAANTTTPTTPVVTPRAAEPSPESGMITISAMGFVNAKDPRFNGDATAAQAEARADAKRQLIEKALALYVEGGSLNKNYSLIEQKLLSQSGNFIKTVVSESAPTTGKDGLIETETRAVIKARDVQRSLNQLSKDERIDFIRNNGNPKIALQMSIAYADGGNPFPPSRSQLAENVIKQQIKSFGFRVWANEGETPTGVAATPADFVVQGQAKLKQLSGTLSAAGLKFTRIAIDSWTLKAIDKATGEEIYLNTMGSVKKSWASEDEALAEIGKLMGDDFAKIFFLQHFNFGVRKTSLTISGLPDADTARLLARELKSARQILDVHMLSESGKFELQLAEGSSGDIVQEAIVKPLNAKLGKACFAMAAASENNIGITFAKECADAATRAKLESGVPAGIMSAPPSRSKSLMKTSGVVAMRSKLSDVTSG